MSTVDIPRPLAVLCTLFRLQPLENLLDDPLFQALRVWNDISDISESESFGKSFVAGFLHLFPNDVVDGHRKVIVEHTLHMLLLPGIHCEGPLSHSISSSSDSVISLPQTPILPHSPQSPPP